MSGARAAIRLAALRLGGAAVVAAGRLAAPGALPFSASERGQGGEVRSPRVLLIRPDHLGDTILASPAARVVRAALPAAQVDWLVGPWSAEVLARCDRGGEILTAAFPGFTRRPKRSPAEPYVVLVKEAARLRGRAYDAALVLRPDHWWGAMLAAAAGIPRRFGFAIPECVPFLTDTLPTPDTHVVRSNQQLARLAAAWLGGRVAAGPPLDPTFAIHDDEIAWARTWLEANAARRPDGADTSPDRPLVALHPGTGAPVKNWLPDRWTEVVAGLRARAGADVVLTGGPTERPLVEAVAARLDPRPPTLVGASTIGQLAALFAASDLVVGGDSGPLHLAATVGTPTLRLYGPTDPVEFGPWPPLDRHDWLAARLPCQHCRSYAPPCGAVDTPPCLLAVEPATVVERALRLLAGQRPATPPGASVTLATADPAD